MREKGGRGGGNKLFHEEPIRAHSHGGLLKN